MGAVIGAVIGTVIAAAYDQPGQHVSARPYRDVRGHLPTMSSRSVSTPKMAAATRAGPAPGHR